MSRDRRHPRIRWTGAGQIRAGRQPAPSGGERPQDDDPRGGQRKSGRARTLWEPGIQDGQGVGELYLGEVAR